MKAWFNQGLSNTYDALRLIRAADLERSGRVGIALRASHADPSAAVACAADEFALEPTGLDDEAYAAWCLEECRSHGVALFVPQRRRAAIAARRATFAGQGVAVSVMGGPAVLDLVDRKHALYADLAGTDVPVPPYRVFRTLAEFDAAVETLSAELGDARLCVKPTVGVYGAGFRVLEHGGCELRRILSGDATRTAFTAFRAALAASAGEREMMLMPYLPGPERSVDVLAHRGSLVRAVARRKEGSHQVLETEGPSLDIAAALTARYGLDGVFNLQTREWNGVPYLLEVNSRMSGGLLYACMAGVALPYWNLLLTAGRVTPDVVPHPLPGRRVAPVQGCVLLP